VAHTAVYLGRRQAWQHYWRMIQSGASHQDNTRCTQSLAVSRAVPLAYATRSIDRGVWLKRIHFGSPTPLTAPSMHVEMVSLII
jgi:hypothetical protein